MTIESQLTQPGTSQCAVKTNGLVQSTCAYCGVGCGVDISVSKGQAMSLTGTPEHPANHGRLCVKGTHLLDTVDLTSRLLAPQIDNQTVDWQTAINAVASRFNRIIDEYGKDAVAFYVSGQLLTEDYYVANKLMKGYIGSANIDTNSRLCMSSAVSAYKRAFGEDIVPCSYTDLEHTDLIVLVGSNAAWTHPVIFQRIERAKQINPNLKVIVIDPRSSATSAGAELHLAIKPGTDAALFNGLIQFLAENQGLDKTYIAKHTQGFEQCLASASAWTLEKVANFCGLTTQTLRTFYQYFLASDSAVTMYSMGVNQSSSGVDKCQSIINVHLASGKMGRKGCGPFSITGQPNAMGGREVGGLANQLTAHMDIENVQHRELVQEFWQSPTIANQQGAKAVELFEQIRAGKIKAIWIMATNPLVSLPDSDKIAQALQACEFVVVSDCVEDNDTLAFADVKLPATPWLEKNGTVTNSERRISRQRGAISPSGLAKHDWQIISLVAQQMGFEGFDYQTPAQIFTEFAALTGHRNQDETARLFDISALARLSEQAYEQLQPIQWPVNKEYPLGCSQIFNDGMFAHSSKKAQFAAIVPKLPQQRLSAQYPLSLNSGRYRDQWHTMTRTGIAAKLTQHLAKPYLTISPKDAIKAKLSDNDLALVRASTGQVIAPVKVSNEQGNGQCFMPIHWNNQFASSARISSLYPSIVDPISGQPESKFTAISIEKLDFAQYADIYITHEMPVEADYWLKTKAAFGWHYQIALSEAKSAEQWTSPFEFNGEWLSLQSGQTTQLMCLKANKLLCVIYLSENQFREPHWLKEYFTQPTLTFSDIQTILAGAAPSAEQMSRKVCSCFNVSEYQIEQAIVKGYSTVEALGDSLKCGTNCGSCKPELQSIINQYQANEKDSIDVVEVVNG